jgi:AraC family transcriptional regulator
MITYGFPDFSLRDHDFDAPCPFTRWPNMLLHSRDRQLEWPEHSAPLSMAMVMSGTGLFRFGRSTLPLEADFYMVIDEDDRFGFTIDAECPVESLHVFLAPVFATQMFTALTRSSTALLDNDSVCDGTPVRFQQKLHCHDQLLSPLLAEIVEVVRGNRATPGWHNEIFYRIATALMQAHGELGSRIARLPALRSTTRTEMMRRLHLALDLIHSSYASPLTLEQMASAALFSAYHFLRAFRTAYGRTPHQYLTALRIERACSLLRTTDLGIAEIGRRVGFEYPTSFTLLFRQHMGVAPSVFRAPSPQPSGYAEHCVVPILRQAQEERE